MKLKSFGCSFIFGIDLHDDGSNKNIVKASQHTWPALLAQRSGYKYKCWARPGSGNLQIMEAVLNQVANPEPAVFVIGWTWIDRFDYVNIHKKLWSRTAQWNTIMPTDTTLIADAYYRDLHSEYRDKLVSLTYIKTAVDALIHHQIPFVMTYIDELMFDQRWHTTPAVASLQDHVRPHMTQFEQQTFLDWSRSNGYPESSTWHPMEQAHVAAADVMQPIFDKRKTTGRAR